jgi:predicted permease
MSLQAYFRSLAAKFLLRSQTETELDEELRAHIQLRADDLERSGLSRSEAHRRARIEFGGYEKFREESHKALGGNFVETLLQDTRFSMRVLRKSPGFTIAAVLTLALAIGANAVVFSVLNAFILRPLDVPHAESLFELQHGDEASAYQSYPNYVDLRDRNHSFESLAGYGMDIVGMDTGKDPIRAWSEETSGNFFDALELKPYLGRFFHASDEHGPNSAPYIVLSYSFWHTHFQDDRSVVGRVVQLNKHPFTIIGVAPQGFHGVLIFFNPDLFAPIAMQEQLSGENDLNVRAKKTIFMVMGHLKPGVSIAQANADLNSIGADLVKTYPKDNPKMSFSLANPNLYGDYLGRPMKAFLSGLMMLSGLILLAACANLGSLFAARAADQSREVALRLALGSSRSRILRRLFTEALIISLIGGAIGLAGSIALLRELSAWQPIPRWPLQIQVNPDMKVYTVALLLTLASGFLFGAVPVRQILRTNPYEVVKSGSISAAGRRISMRDVLLVIQIAICGVLVTSSAVAVRGLLRSLHDNFGFQVSNVMLADTDLTMAGYKPGQIPVMQKRMLQALQTIPGVDEAGLIDSVPLGDNSGSHSNVFNEKSTDLRPAHAVLDALIYTMSPEYLHAAGTTLLAGKNFTWHDDLGTPRVAVVNREFANKVFGSVTNAVGGNYKLPDGTRVQVTGVVEDGKYESLTEDPQPVMFYPILQSPSRTTWFVVRSRRDPLQVGAAIRTAMRNLDAGLPIYIQTRYQEMDAMLFAARMATVSLGVMGIMGAMLAVTGIFGMAAYSVSRRLRELGIRVALGAQRTQVLHAALGRALKLLAMGSAAGLFLGLLATKVLAYIVYQATPRDPIVLAAVVFAMLFLGLVATWIPAQRALSVNPLKLLRED